MSTIKITAVIFFFILATFSKKDSKTNILTTNKAINSFYVALNGNDSNPGTKKQPWRTIQKAAKTISYGQKVIIKPGYYNEYVIIKNSGTSNTKRIIFQSEKPYKARCEGFKIYGHFVTIDGFDVEANGHTNWTGILAVKASNTKIQNCYIHECPTGGINIKIANNAVIINNKIDHNGQWGINILGHNALIENNEILNTVQHHSKGHEPGFSGADADGMRIFGNNHIIRSNIVKNIGDPNDIANKNPHVDCIQTWDGGKNGRPVMSNTIIEGNFFSSKHASSKGIIIDATKGNTCHNLIIRNNIFEFSDIGISAYSGKFKDIFIYNNIFKATIGAKSWGTSVALKNVKNYALLNNITIDCHPEHRNIKGGSGKVDYNMAWNSDGSKPRLIPALQANELSSVDPKFVSYTGIYGKNDYHLLSNSPAINSGITLKDVPIDFEGVSRPQGGAYDRGVYEYRQN